MQKDTNPEGGLQEQNCATRLPRFKGKAYVCTAPTLCSSIDCGLVHSPSQVACVCRSGLDKVSVQPQMEHIVSADTKSLALCGITKSGWLLGRQ